MKSKGGQLERAVVQALRNQAPVRDLPGVRITAVREQPKERFDISFEMQSGKSRVLALGEIKPAVSPKLLEELAPWIQRMKSLREDVAFVLISPAISPRSQEYCIRNSIDFLDLTGNVSINVPGKFVLQRLGMRSKERGEPVRSFPGINVFSGRSSRVLRVLLERPKPWTLTEIARELEAETQNAARAVRNQQLRFEISLGAVSKAVATLEEQLWIQRQGSTILVPEPGRLLTEWAERYKERYRWRLRSSFQTSNPFGPKLSDIAEGLRPVIASWYAFTGAAAAIEAPFVELDKIDVFVTESDPSQKLRELNLGRGAGPKLRFIYPYDIGVFMYSRIETSIPAVSNIQAYLDLYARGGRDLKQADFLLNNAIVPRWKAT
ncbi:MAG: hypothetical protein M1453_05160 [Acidobacteria bacterium]|nr:hypothetical protein [Acidobacteriota bacterium]